MYFDFLILFLGLDTLKIQALFKKHVMIWLLQ